MSKKVKELPPLEILDDLLVYIKDSGEFFWKHREVKYFNATAKRTKESHQEQWNSHYAGAVAGGVNKATGYHVIRIFGKDYLAHRLAYLMSTGVDPLEMTIDHINQNKVDNSFSNLRLATRSDQQRNRPIQATNSSGTVGITPYQHDPSCWVGRIKVDGKKVSIKNPRTGKQHFEDFERPALERLIADKYRELGFHENHGSKLKSIKGKE